MEQTEQEIRPTFPGTVCILFACLVGYYFSIQDQPPSIMARNVSYAWLAGISLSLLIDWRLHGLRNLIRMDVFALASLYFLTFFEFLFPQSRFDFLVVGEDVVTAVHLSLIGLAALAIGRHIQAGPKDALSFIGKVRMGKGDFLLIYFGAFVFGHLYMWLAVDFDPVAWWEGLTSPRFGRPWGRGRYGNLSTLLGELKLLGYVMPPIAGVIFARHKEYGKGVLVLVGFTLLVLWFVAFSAGSRNVLAIQMAGFLGGFFIVQKHLRLWALGVAAVAFAAAFVVLAEMMLEFRNIGLSQYIEENRFTTEYSEFEESYLGTGYTEGGETGYFVDYNLWRMSQLVAVFPGMYGYLGWNLPFVAITKPIPRALWPGKPEDLAVGLEEAIGAEGYTIACTWIGEAYVAGGLLWIVGVGLLIGIFCGFWNQLAQFIGRPFPLIVFASGFFAILLLMRSLMFFTTALLPSIALIALGFFLYRIREAE